MFAVLSSIAKGIPEEELDSDDLKPLLLSLRFFKAKYTHMPNQEDFFLRSTACSTQKLPAIIIHCAISCYWL